MMEAGSKIFLGLIFFLYVDLNIFKHIFSPHKLPINVGLETQS